MENLSFLFEDPRPELPDTRHWDKLLKAFASLEDRDTAYFLHTNIWTMRSAGVILRRHIGGGLRFEPIIGPGGDFDSVDFFDDLKRQLLMPYSMEIRQLFRKVDGYE